MARKKKWNPRLLAPHDIVAADLFMRSWGASNKTPDRVRDDFKTFCLLNSLQHNEEQTRKLWIGQMINAGMKSSSIETYLGYVSHRRDAVYRAVALAHADSDTRHAVDANEEKLLTAVQDCTNVSLKSLLWVLFNFGSRVQDLRRMRRRQFRLLYSKKATSLEMRCAKNMRSRRLRKSVVVPWAWRSPPSPHVAYFLQNGHPDERLFWNTSLRNVNAELKQHNLSSYSFRRNFMHFLYLKFDNIEERMRFSLHISKETLDAFYAKREEEEVNND